MTVWKAVSVVKCRGSTKHNTHIFWRLSIRFTLFNLQIVLLQEKMSVLLKCVYDYYFQCLHLISTNSHCKNKHLNLQSYFLLYISLWELFTVTRGNVCWVNSANNFHICMSKIDSTCSNFTNSCLWFTRHWRFYHRNANSQ